MELKIYWTDFAKEELNLIFSYHKENASLKVARNIVSGIVLNVKVLQNQPKIGQIEELLINHKNNYRYLLHKNYKIIYWINLEKERVEVIDVFDVRQNPKKIDSFF